MLTKKFLPVLTLAWILGSSLAVNAALINEGHITRDTESGLEWLNFSETQDFSFNYISTQFHSGGLFEGWQFATTSQATELFNNAGGSGLYDGSYDPDAHNNAASLLLDLMGTTRPPNSLYRQAAVHIHGNSDVPELAGFHIREWTPDASFDILEINQFMFATGESEPGSALALVRTYSVNEPSAIILLLLSLVFLFFCRQQVVGRV